MPARAPRRALARLAVLAATLALAAVGCGPLSPPTPIPAASDTKTENRQLATFSSITVDGPLNVVYGTGGLGTVQVVAPSNVLGLVQTQVTGGDLAITVAPPGYTSANPVTVRISASTVTSISLTGGATGTLEVIGQAFAVSASGGAIVKAIGSVQHLTVAVLGSSIAELGDLEAQTASISIAGGARATLRVVKQLTGTADGGSVVTLVIEPEAKSVTVTGGAKLEGP